MKSLNTKVFAAITLLMASSVFGFAQTRSFEHDLSPFEGIEATDGFKVSVSKSDGYSAKLTVDDALESYVQCYVKAGVLHIGLDDKAIPKDLKKQYKGRNSSEPTLVAVVRIPELKTLLLSDDCKFFSSSDIAASDLSMTLTGSASANNLRITGKTFNLTVSKNAKFTNASVTVEGDLGVTCDSKGIVTLEYKANNLKVTSSGSAEMDIRGDAEEKVSIDASGSSKTTLSGSSKAFEVTGKGTSAKVAASALETLSATITATGISVETNASDNLELDLGRGTEVIFAGNPAINIIKIQAATVTRK